MFPPIKRKPIIQTLQLTFDRNTLCDADAWVITLQHGQRVTISGISSELAGHLCLKETFDATYMISRDEIPSLFLADGRVLPLDFVFHDDNLKFLTFDLRALVSESEMLVLNEKVAQAKPETSAFVPALGLVV
ncbi:MAG: hypothetical protein AAB388_02855 [Patescibacteria group bacterium]